MRPNKKTSIAVISSVLVGATAAVVLVETGAFAQTGGPMLEAPELAPPEELNLTPAQQVELSSKTLPQMEQGAGTVRRQLEQSRSARDLVKTLCLQDKLAQIDVAIRSARDRFDALRAAAGRNDVERSKHEFMVILVLRDRVRSLLAEANQCIGEETGFIDEDNKVTVEIDPTIPDDPADYPRDDLIVTPPTLSSPIE